MCVCACVFQAGPVVADIDVVCQGFNMEIHEEPSGEPTQVSAFPTNYRPIGGAINPMRALYNTFEKTGAKTCQN